MKSFVLLLSLLSTAFGYNILCLSAVPSRSHTHLGKGLVDALLKAGHRVTWLTPFPPEKPTKGLTIIDASPVRAIADAIDMTNKRNADAGISFVQEFARNVSIATNQLPALREVLVSTQFDAVVNELFFSDVDAGYAAVQQVPWITLHGQVMMPTLEAIVDEVRTISTIPFLTTSFPIPMNFWQRLVNTFIYSMITLDGWKHQAANEELYNSMFAPLAAARGVPLPSLNEAIHNISVLFVNADSTFAPAQSLPPNVIQIGGYHIDENTPPLPKDLQDLLDGSPQGVVYFSMGSVVKSSAMPQQTRRDLLRVLGALPYTVLWKFEKNLEDLPKNVHIRQWMPQPSILAHPNVKVFITHGGLLSTLESLHYGVPLLAVPVFGDQPSNADRAVRAGFALKVDFRPDMAEDLAVALKEMMSNDSYYKKAKYLSKLFRNRPVSNSKLISHYVELAIESKGAYHLRSKTHLYAWYERWMLDQAAAIIAVLYVFYIVLKKAYRACFRGRRDKKMHKDKRN